MRFAHFSHVWKKPGLAIAERYDQEWRELESCDNLPFEYAFCVEHHFNPVESLMPSPASYCAAAAARTKHLRIGPMGYVVPLYTPVRVLEEAAVLDNLLHGRLELGLVSGAGSRQDDFEIYGASYDTRQALTNEVLHIVKRAFASNKPLTFHGSYYTYDNVVLSVSTVQRPHPPLWLESRTPSTLAMLAEEGVNTGYVFMSERSEIGPAYRTYLEDWERAGHAGRPNISYWTLVYVDDSDSLARSRAWPQLHYVFNQSVLLSEADAQRNARIREQRGEPRGADVIRHLSDPDYLIDHDLVFVGSPTSVAHKIRRAAEEGTFNTLLCEFNFGSMSDHDLEHSIQLFGAEVIPALDAFEPF
jgi:alkanesulfonate monooxygenase SsuD/methylene tetrahydromethanopterin reductase-like flavin-dependent oxidoreductase (luciferase family)